MGEFKNSIKIQQYPNHIINILKQHLLDTKTFSYNGYMRQLNFPISSNYSNLETLRKNQNYILISKLLFIMLLLFLEIFPENGEYLEMANLEGLSSSLKSLSLRLASIDRSSFIGNLYSLKVLNLDIKSRINNDMLIQLFEICPNIEELYLGGEFSSINLDNFVNLKKLKLSGNLLIDFNFDLFENISTQLEHLFIEFSNMNNKRIGKLLCRHNFRNLSQLTVSKSKVSRFEKNLFDGFPIIQSLNVIFNRKLIKNFIKKHFRIYII